MSISVIIPCYRAQDTLRRAVDSALADAPADLQLILVEDGSPDGTGVLCDELAAGDARIIALHRPNGGASAARNTGLDAASGDWVLFLDADDTLLPGLWRAVAPLLTGNTDWVWFGLSRGGGPAPLPAGRYATPSALAAQNDALEHLLLETGYLASPCAKLYRRDALQDLRFEETLKINEDVLFNLLFFQKSPAISSLNDVYYKVIECPGSLSRQLRGDLLDAEEFIRPVLTAVLDQLCLPPARRDALLRRTRVRAAMNQYGLLTGCKGDMPFVQRRTLFARILADPDARTALTALLREDPNRLLAIPYRLGLALRSPGWLALYTQIKNRFL